jgi:hypothetical protein
VALSPAGRDLPYLSDATIMSDEIIKRLEMIARLHSLMLDIEHSNTSDARETWAWKARNRILELQADLAEAAKSRHETSELIREGGFCIVAPDTEWRHRKTGYVYLVVGGCRIEATGDAGVLYARAGIVHCRPVDEFLDGRFEVL